MASEMNTEVSKNPGLCERIHTLSLLNSSQASSLRAGKFFQYGGFAVFFLISILVIFFTISLAFAQPEPSKSVPAEFVRQVQTQEKASYLRRPSAIFIDKAFKEIYVADMGRNSVVVFDQYGNQRFAFIGEDHFAVPLDLAVTADGFIYVLGSTTSGNHIFVFDYDGLFLNRLELEAPEGPVVTATCFALDSKKNIYLLVSDRQVIAFDKNGKYSRTIDIISALSKDEETQETMLGTISIVDDKILVPSSMAGRLYVYDLAGNLIAQAGRKGTKAGELSFPIAATIYDSEMYLVLDKHRFNVVCYDLSGKFLGEFGGKGFRNGWFYHPTLLATDNNGQVYVGQLYEGRIQVCKMPDFILQEVAANQTDSALTIGNLNPEGNQSTIDNETTLQLAGAQKKEVTAHSLRVTGSPASGDPSR